MTRFLLVCLGGAIGSGARYVMALWAAHAFGTAFPVGTLVVNIIGSFALGLVMHIGTATEILSPNVRIALATGLLGGFTTYSSFNYETTSFFRGGAWIYGAANVIITVFACLAAGLLGVGLARLWVSR